MAINWVVADRESLFFFKRAIQEWEELSSINDM